MIKFAKFSEAELVAVNEIVPRALALFQRMRIRNDAMSLWMDLSVTHAQLPLKLNELANADDFNFSHDIIGIYRHLDRTTGELGNCFVPRYAARTSVLTP